MASYMGNFGLFGSSFNSNSWMSNMLGDYASIRNGSYKKLLTAYYSKPENSSSSNAASNLLNSSVDKTATAIKSDADSLAKSADALITKGSKSLFTQKDITTTDEKTGEKVTTKGYDVDAITKAVKSFVNDYNDLIDSASDSSDGATLRRTLMMTQNTSAYQKSLQDIGITIGKNNKLSIDEDKLKSADMNSVKNLFNGTTSFAYRTSQQASMIGQSAMNAATKASTYNSNGKYNYYNHASSFNAYF